jgi:hypothetical protein
MLTRLAALAVVPFANGCAVFQHMFVAAGVSTNAYRNHAVKRTGEGRIGFSLDAFPSLAFALSGTGVSDLDEADYFEAKCFTWINGARKHTGCSPRISAWTHAFDVQKRWRATQTLHPLASVVFGHAGTGNIYADSARFVSDSTRTSAFMTLSGGGELNIASWLHVTATAGYREVFQRNTPIANVSPSGFTLTSLLVIGKPYR